MTSFLLSLDEIERVKRMHGLHTTVDIAAKTGVSRNTWSKALSTRKPTPQVLEALALLGARASRVLISEDMAELTRVA